MSNYKSNDNSTENTTLKEWWEIVKSEISRIFGILNNDAFTAEMGYESEIDSYKGTTDGVIYKIVKGSQIADDGTGTIPLSNETYYIFAKNWNLENESCQYRFDKDGIFLRTLCIIMGTSSKWSEWKKIGAVGELTSGGGEIFNDYDNNKALSIHSAAMGSNCTAGGKGFAIVSQEDLGDGTGIYTLSSTEGLEVGITYSVKLSTAKYNAGTITAIDGASVTVDGYTYIEPSSEEDIASATSEYYRTNYLTITGRPDLGDMEVGFNAIALGEDCIVQDRCGFATGYNNRVIGQYGFANGRGNVVGYAARGSGKNNKATGDNSATDGNGNEAAGANSYAGGKDTKATNYAAVSFGLRTVASGADTLVSGVETEATGDHSQAFGRKTKASGFASLSTGNETEASGENSASMGFGSKANAPNSLATGISTEASGYGAASFGNGTKATSDTALSLGNHTTASAPNAIATGKDTVARGYAATSFGKQTYASSDYQLVHGKHNIDDKNNTYAHIVGNGQSTSTPSNAYTLDWDGNGWFAGEITVGADKDKLATESFVTEQLASVEGSDVETIDAQYRPLPVMMEDGSFNSYLPTEMGSIKKYKIINSVENTPIAAELIAINDSGTERYAQIIRMYTPSTYNPDTEPNYAYKEWQRVISNITGEMVYGAWNQTFPIEIPEQVDITIDSALNETSENPVQNKVVTESINDIKDDIVSITGSRTRINCNIGDKIPTGDCVKLVEYACGVSLDGYPTVTCTNPADGSTSSISYGEVLSSVQGHTISNIRATDWNFNEIYQDSVDESRYLIFEVVNYGTIPSIEVKVQENSNAQILSSAGTHTIKCYVGNTVPSSDNITSIVFKNLVMDGETAHGNIYYGDDSIFDLSGDSIIHHSGELITKIGGGSNTVEIYEEDCYAVLEVTANREEIVDTLCLTSPDGTVYKLIVDDNGNLSVINASLVVEQETVIVSYNNPLTCDFSECKNVTITNNSDSVYVAIFNADGTYMNYINPGAEVILTGDELASAFTINTDPDTGEAEITIVKEKTL